MRDAFILHAQKGRVFLQLRCIFMGQDICIVLDGGDIPHIGAMALACAGNDNAPSLLVCPHHREGELAQNMAQRMAQALGTTVSVVCGVHIDNITKEEITLVHTMARELVDACVQNIFCSKAHP